MPLLGSPVAAQPAAPFSWSGYYLGIHGALAHGRDAKLTEPTEGKGSSFGLHGGRNWQAGHLVYGIEGDINVLGPAIHTNFFNRSITDKRVNMSGTLRGRIGYASGDWLFFVTGGYAFAQFEQDFTSITRPFNRRTFGHSDDIIHGGMIGAGFEQAVRGNWRVRAEYQFTVYYHELDAILTAPVVRTLAARDLLLEMHTLRIGVSYRFATQ